MAIQNVSVQGVNKTNGVTPTSAKKIEGGRFVNTQAFREVVGGLGDRAPVYTASSAGSRVASANPTVTFTV